MASIPPPFQVEDNTDEDFFDKLVNDDDDVDFKVTTSSASGGDILTDGIESDDARAFANLSVNELDNNGEVNFENNSGSNHTGIDDLSADLKTVEHINKVGTVEDSGNPLLLPNSLERDNMIQNLGKENGGAEASSSATEVSKNTDESSSDVTKSSGGSGAPGVKEVQWSAFHADSGQNDSNDFGSYSDYFGEFGGDNASDTFGNIVGDSSNNGAQVATGNDVHVSAYVDNWNNSGQYNEGYNDGIAANQSTNVQDLNSSEYWESQYPGWKYDVSKGLWYQIDGYDAGASVQANVDSNISSTWEVADGQAEFSYMQQTAQCVAGAVPEAGTTECVTNWNQASHLSDATEITTNWNQISQVGSDSNGVSSDWNQTSHDSNGYPPHMVFDPQYPGWYYDTISQEWCTLESCNALTQSIAQVQDQVKHDKYASTDTYSQTNNLKAGSTQGTGDSYTSQGFSTQGLDLNWVGSGSNDNQQSSRIWLPETVASSEATVLCNENQLMENNQYGQSVSVSSHGNQQTSVHCGVKGSYYEILSQGQKDFSMLSQFAIDGNLSQQFNDPNINQNDRKHFSNDYLNNQNSVNLSQQQVQNAQISYSPASGRSSAGRPAHAFVAFGFVGKLIVMKHDYSTENLNFGSRNPAGGSISVLYLAEVVNVNIDTSDQGTGVSNDFEALYRKAIPGPLIGGSVGTKELNKWIDERITNPESADMDHREAEVLRLLLSLLKVACQYYGKLRSPYGTDAVMKGSDAPESAVANLFASAKRNGLEISQYGGVAQCLQPLPSEGQMQVTAAEVKNLLVSGRKIEALQYAQEGQLWGPALILAAQLGDQFYVETVKQMALHQLVAGSPLRTLCLLLLGNQLMCFQRLARLLVTLLVP